MAEEEASSLPAPVNGSNGAGPAIALATGEATEAQSHRAPAARLDLTPSEKPELAGASR